MTDKIGAQNEDEKMTEISWKYTRRMKGHWAHVTSIPH